MRGPADRQGAAHHDVAGDAAEVVVQAEPGLGIGAQAGLDLVGGAGRPQRGLGEVVEQHGRILCIRRICRTACKQNHDEPALHFPLPIISPCT